MQFRARRNFRACDCFSQKDDRQDQLYDVLYQAASLHGLCATLAWNALKKTIEIKITSKTSFFCLMNQRNTGNERKDVIMAEEE